MVKRFTQMRNVIGHPARFQWTHGLCHPDGLNFPDGKFLIARHSKMERLNETQEYIGPIVRGENGT